MSDAEIGHIRENSADDGERWSNLTVRRLIAHIDALTARITALETECDESYMQGYFDAQAGDDI